MDREKIIKAMECHNDCTPCVECPYKGVQFCSETLEEDALSLIKELTEEIEILTKALESKCNECSARERANTVREMQAEIINRCIKGGIYPAFVATTIDKIAKEMIDNVGTRCNRGSL